MVVLRRVTVLAALAAVTVGLGACERRITRVENVQQASGCFSCHSDQNTILVAAEQQWRNSKHASGERIDRNAATCAGCHTSEGFVARASGQPVVDVPNPTTIHCFTCHAPHTNGDFRLRWTATTTLQNGTSFDLGGGNLCAACHQARRNVTTYVSGRPSLNSFWGPHHSNQADMLIGSNGYHYAGYTYEISNHRTAVTDACAGCHVLRATSNNVVGGHTFAMRATLEGREILNTEACKQCHGTLTKLNVNAVRDTVDALIGELSTLLEAKGLWSGGDPATIKTSADSAGAVWNLLMAIEDQSHGVHNAKYTKGLLRSSILYIKGQLPQPARLVRASD